jgi:hypothetical protein
MLKKSQLVFMGAVSISALAIGNAMSADAAKVGGSTQTAQVSDDKCGMVCQRKRAIEEAEKKHKEEAVARPALTRKSFAELQAERKATAEEKKAEEGKKAAEKEINLSHPLKIETVEEEHIILKPLAKKVEAGDEPMKRSTKSAPPKKFAPLESTVTEETITLPLPSQMHKPSTPGVAPSSTPDGLKAPADKPQVSGHDALMEAIRKRRVD